MMIQFVDAGIGVEVGILDACDLQRRAVKLDPGGPARQQIQ